MSVIKLSTIGLLSMAFITLFSCQKDLAEPTLTSNAGKGGRNTSSADVEPAFRLVLPDADVTCATSTTYCFNTSLLNNGGQPVGGNTTIYAEIWDATSKLYTSAILNVNQGAVCFSDLELPVGQYSVFVYYQHGSSVNAQPQNGKFSYPLTVQAAADCGTTTCQTTGLTFSRNPVIVLNQSFRQIQADVTYTVTNCTSDQTFNNLKIQGGLVNKAGEPALMKSGTGLITSFVSKKNGGNYILTGYFDLTPGTYANFNVKYSVATACNNYLTGEWSVKNGPTPVVSTDLATSDPYYMNRLRSVCL